MKIGWPWKKSPKDFLYVTIRGKRYRAGVVLGEARRDKNLGYWSDQDIAEGTFHQEGIWDLGSLSSKPSWLLTHLTIAGNIYEAGEYEAPAAPENYLGLYRAAD